MPLTLFSTANNYSLYKVQIAAKLAGQDLKVEEVKTVHDKTPHNKGPVLDTGRGYLFQSNAIVRYLARLSPANCAYGNSLADAAQVDQWIDFCLNEFEAPRGVWLFPVLRMMELNPRSYKAAKKAVGGVLRHWNNHLASRTYFVGHAPTIADAVVFSALLDMYSTVFAPGFVKSYTHLNRWFATVAHHPAFAGVVGEVTYATEEKKAPAPKKKQQQQPKKKKQQQQQKKKEKKKRPPKPKHPCQLLPPTSMNLDATKKLFFNERPFNKTFFPGFWDNYDHEGYSWWQLTYKYPQDHKVFWKTQNAVGMFVQRLDSARKWAFGAMLLLGADEETLPFNVTGMFLCRGPVLVPEILENPSTEHYEQVKVDVTTEEGRALVQAYTQGEQVGSLNVLDRRYFK